MRGVLLGLATSVPLAVLAVEYGPAAFVLAVIATLAGVASGWALHNGNGAS